MNVHAKSTNPSITAAVAYFSSFLARPMLPKINAMVPKTNGQMMSPAMPIIMPTSPNLIGYDSAYIKARTRCI